MKIDKSKLTQIIKEEVGNAVNVRVSANSTEDPVEEGLGTTIVDTMTKYFHKITRGTLYAQLLKATLDLPLHVKISELPQALRTVAGDDERFYLALKDRLGDKSREEPGEAEAQSGVGPEGGDENI